MPDYEGLVIKCKSGSIETALNGIESKYLDRSLALDEQNASYMKLMQQFVEHVVEWNLDDEDGLPVERSVAGLKALDPDFVSPIINVWRVNIFGRVAAPLEIDSPGGEKSLEESIPMETLLPSLAS